MYGKNQQYDECRHIRRKKGPSHRIGCNPKHGTLQSTSFLSPGMRLGMTSILPIDASHKAPPEKGPATILGRGRERKTHLHPSEDTVSQRHVTPWPAMGTSPNNHKIPLPPDGFERCSVGFDKLIRMENSGQCRRSLTQRGIPNQVLLRSCFFNGDIFRFFYIFVVPRCWPATITLGSSTILLQYRVLLAMARAPSTGVSGCSTNPWVASTAPAPPPLSQGRKWLAPGTPLDPSAPCQSDPELLTISPFSCQPPPLFLTMKPPPCLAPGGGVPVGGFMGNGFLDEGC